MLKYLYIPTDFDVSGMMNQFLKQSKNLTSYFLTVPYHYIYNKHYRRINR